MIHGLLLAAGAGRRMGRPKALVPGWLRASVAALRAGGCDRVTVVLGAGADEAAPLLAAVRDLPVLTVGEGSTFVKHGGAIGFFLDNNRVRFDISQLALQRAGLKASSKLLRVARNVEGGAP